MKTVVVMTLFVPFLASFLLMFMVLRRLTSAAATLPSSVLLALGSIAAFGLLQLCIWVSPTPAVLLVVLAGMALATQGMQGEGLAPMTAALGSSRFALYLLAVITLASLIYLFVPITTFLTSPGELSIHLDFLLTRNARDAMVLVYLALAVYALAFSPRLRTALTLIAVAAVTVALLYSYALPFGYPMMTGLTFELMPVSPLTQGLRMLADLAVVVLVACGLRYLLQRFGARPLIASALVVNVSLAAAAAVGILRDRVGEAGGPHSAAQLPAQPLRFSRSQPNVLILFLDRFMGSYVEGILATDPALKDRLSGFTWYPRSVSAGENSIAGLHPMLGGYDYLPDVMNRRDRPLVDLSVEAYSILPRNFAAKGYQVNVVNPKGLGFTMAGDCRFLVIDGVHCAHIPQSVSKHLAQEMGVPLNDLATANYADLLVLLGAMRSVPYATKGVILRRGPWRPFLDHSAGTTFREWAELRSLPLLTNTDATEPNLNFVSNILAHEPYYMGEDCQPKRQRLVVSEEEVQRRGHRSLFSLQHAVTARCVLLSVADYMDYLKTQGVYDNTRIVIVSDHGIVGPVDDLSSRALAGGTQSPGYVRTRSVLLVKPRGASGALQVSETFMPNAETPRIVCEEIGGCVNPYLANRPITAQGRDDPFLVSIVPWQFSRQDPRAFVILEQFALEGRDPYDAHAWKVLKARSYE